MMHHQICASCREGRLQCVQDCSMAPYFPAHMHKIFKNAHQVFGRSYITKLLHDLRGSPQRSNIAMKNLLAEVDFRIGDPVGGCYGIMTKQRAKIRRLQRKVAEQDQELQSLLRVAQPSWSQEQGNIVLPRTQQEQGSRNLGEQIGNASQGQGNFVRVFGQRFQQEQTSIDAQRQAYAQPPNRLLQLFPESNQEQGNRDEVVVPEQDDGVEAQEPNLK